MNKTAILILAAGNSSRLGRPKQLLYYRGRQLITHVVGEAFDAGLEPIIVVTGAFEAQVRAVLPEGQFEVIYNPQWEIGMGSSIMAGIAKLESFREDVESVILAVCDQPYISSGLLQRLRASQRATGKGIIACSYAETVGTPVLFTRSYFSALLALSGNDGAKKLLRQHPDDVQTIPFPRGEIDIDTEADYRHL